MKEKIMASIQRP